MLASENNAKIHELDHSRKIDRNQDGDNRQPQSPLAVPTFPTLDEVIPFSTADQVTVHNIINKLKIIRTNDNQKICD